MRDEAPDLEPSSVMIDRETENIIPQAAAPNDPATRRSGGGSP